MPTGSGRNQSNAPCLLWMSTSMREVAQKRPGPPCPIMHEIEEGRAIVVEVRSGGVPQHGSGSLPQPIMTILSRVGLNTLRRIDPVLSHHSSAPEGSAPTARVTHNNRECDHQLCT